MNYYKPPQQGWICPKCGRVNAPWLPTCGCVSSQTRATFDTTPLADRKTEPLDKDINVRSKDEPQIFICACETCKHRDEDWDSEACDGCCENNDHYEPKTEPQTEICLYCEHYEPKGYCKLKECSVSPNHKCDEYLVIEPYEVKIISKSYENPNNLKAVIKECDITECDYHKYCKERGQTDCAYKIKTEPQTDCSWK